MADDSILNEEDDMDIDGGDSDILENESDSSEKKGIVKKIQSLPRKKIIILSLAVVVVLLLLTAGLVVFKMLGSSDSEETMEGTGAVDSNKIPEIELSLPDTENILPLEPFKIPISDDLGDYELNVKIEVETPNSTVLREVEKRAEEIREALLPILSKRSPNTLQSLAEKIELRKELIIQVNKMLKKGKIKNIYFSELVFI